MACRGRPYSCALAALVITAEGAQAGSYGSDYKSSFLGRGRELESALQKVRTQTPAAPRTVKVAVGSPPQVLLLAVDTSESTTWLVDAGAQSVQEGLLRNVSMYRPLSSWSVRNLPQSEVQPRAWEPSGPVLPEGGVTGRRVFDDLRLGDDLDTLMPQWPLLLVEKLPVAVCQWGIAGVLGLGMRAGAGAQSNDLGTVIAQERVRSRHVLPLLSLYADLNSSSSENIRLFFGNLHSVAWAPLSAAGTRSWATDGAVAIGANSSSGSYQQRIILLVAASAHGLGAPASIFPEVLRALLPDRIRHQCWLDVRHSTGYLVHCKCSVVPEAQPVVFTVASRDFSLTAKDIFFRSGPGDNCTAQLSPLFEHETRTWHLGSPFLVRYGVTLDLSDQRIGFAPLQTDLAVKMTKGVSLADGRSADIVSPAAEIGQRLQFFLPGSAWRVRVAAFPRLVFHFPVIFLVLVILGSFTSAVLCGIVRRQQKPWVLLSTRSPSVSDDEPELQS